MQEASLPVAGEKLIGKCLPVSSVDAQGSWFWPQTPLCLQAGHLQLKVNYAFHQIPRHSEVLGSLDAADFMLITFLLHGSAFFTAVLHPCFNYLVYVNVETHPRWCWDSRPSDLSLCIIQSLEPAVESERDRTPKLYPQTVSRGAPSRGQRGALQHHRPSPPGTELDFSELAYQCLHLPSPLEEQRQVFIS